MSDDTPTRRLPEPGDDAPTQRLPGPGDDAPTQRLDAPTAETAAAGAVAPESGLAGEQRRSRALLATLLAIGGALLIALIVLLFLLFNNNGIPASDATPSDSPSASPSVSVSPSPTPAPSETPTPTPTPEPEPTETEAPPPPPAGPTISSFSITPETVNCPSADSSQSISVTWSASNVDQVFFGVDTNDASAEPFFTNLPPSGTSQEDFPEGYEDFQHQCSNTEMTYTLTVVGSGGEKVSRSITVTSEFATE